MTGPGVQLGPVVEMYLMFDANELHALERHPDGHVSIRKVLDCAPGNPPAVGVRAMHDRNGNRLKVGDVVLIEAEITKDYATEEYCNVELRTIHGRRPDGQRETIGAVRRAPFPSES